MRVIVEGLRLDLVAADAIGQGGEAIVYRSGDRAIKIYQGLTADALAEKAEKLRTYPRSVPAGVIAPLAMAYDVKGHLVGYAMRFLDGALDGQRLASKKHRGGVPSGQAVTAATVTQWLRALAGLLEALHAAKVVAGDLNEGNVLWAQGTAWIIDADSHQFGNHPCTVAHEKYLDPRLYGVDLSSRCALSVSSDWYAFAVLAFSVWLFGHPYGGVHPTLGTMARRAEARVSVLRPDVTRPKSLLSFEVLPPALLDWFSRTFDGDLREKMPATLLDLVWTTCACGLEHARQTCPACASRGVIRARPVVDRHGRVRAIVIASGVRDVAAFQARPSRVRLEGDYLVDGDGLRVGQILEGATVVSHGSRLGFGYYRAGKLTHHFLWRVGRAGLVPVALPAIEGRLVGHQVVFDDQHVLVAWQSVLNGRLKAFVALIDASGRVLGSASGHPDDSPLLTSTSGFALAGGRVLRATERGVLSVVVDASALLPGSLFVDAEPFVSEGCELLPGPGGSLYVVTEERITQLCLEGE